MFGTHFYHQRLRKSVAIFGTLFNNLYVLRKDNNNRVISQVKVPLSYAPQRSFLERIRNNPDLDNDTKVSVKLPRLSFEITSIAYDQGRQLQKTNQFQQLGSSLSLRNRFYSFVPYNIGFQLSVYAKNQDDALQVVEQILPFFNPQYTLTMKPFSDFPDILEDVPIALVGVDFNDDYEGELAQRRTIVYSLQFDMRVNFYGPIKEQGVVRTSINNLYESTAGLNDSDGLLERITVTPNPTTTFGSVDSDFGFTTLIEAATTPYVFSDYVEDNYVTP